MADDQEIYEKHKVVYHYTTEAGLKGILESQTLWATHYKYLNDATEIEHMRSSLIDRLTPVAKSVVLEHFRGSFKAKKKIRELGGVNALAKHEAESVVDAYYRITFEGGKSDAAFAEPFITSFCSHGDDKKYIQENGLLSQWRSYGDEVGYAIVFDTKELKDLIEKEAAEYQYSAGSFGDVVYDGNDDVFQEEFGEFIDAFKEMFLQFLQGGKPNMGKEVVPFVTSVSRFKHQGFEEEREVRIIASPVTETLRRLFRSTEPSYPSGQRKPKEIKLRKTGAVNVPYIELFDFPKSPPLPIRKIIIGPHENQHNLEKEVKRMIEGLDIEVHCSETPYIRRR